MVEGLEQKAARSSPWGPRFGANGWNLKAGDSLLEANAVPRVPSRYLAEGYQPPSIR
jgi:hypothetical protein